MRERFRSSKHVFFTVAFIVIFFAWTAAFHDHRLLKNVAITLFPVIGAGFAFAWTLRTSLRLTDKSRYTWLLYSMGMLCFIVAQGTWFYNLLISEKAMPYPSGSDLFWLMQYGMNLLAALYHLTLIRKVTRIRFIFNTVIFMVVASSLSFQFLIKPILESGERSMPALFTSLSYPILDLGVLLATISLYYHSKYSLYKKTILLLASGFTLQIVADNVNNFLIATGQYQPGNLNDHLWTVAVLLVGLAAVYARRHSASDRREQDSSLPIESKYDFLPYASAITLLLIFVFLQDRDGINPLEVGLFTVILLILFRQLLMTADNGKLLVQLRDKNEELGKSEERYRELVEISPSAVTVIQEGRIVYLNRAGLQLLGAASLDDIANMQLQEIVHKDNWDLISLRFQLARENGNAIKPTEYKVNRLDGRTIYIESALTNINYNGKSALLSVAQDITARKLADEKIQRMAYNDLLTGLPNRARLHDRLSEQLAAVGHNGARLGVLFIDLDRFKFINDSLGHNIGDLFLRQVSERLTSILGLNSVLYRHGGDEFCVIAEVEGREEARAIAEQIIEGLSAPFLLNQRELFTSPSIGISVSPDDAEDQGTLVKYADIAMYNAKQEGGNCYRFYDSALDGANASKLNIENSLRKALDKSEFIIHYQPKVDLCSGEIIGLEALVRWLHPERGLVPPLEFIPVAEETGLIVPLGKWVLEEACRQMKQWHERGYAKLGIAVNFSSRQFRDKNMVNHVARTLQLSGLDPECLEIELTESIMQNVKESLVILSELKQLGVQISIDDFGTGYSSLSYREKLLI